MSLLKVNEIQNTSGNADITNVGKSIKVAITTKTDTFSADQKRTVKQVVRNDADNLYAQGLYARYLMHAQSYKKAIPLLQRVARQNCDSNQKKALRFIKGAALCSLGYCHQNGHELEQSYEEAVRYYLLAENEGHALAQYNLGVMYHSGQHVEQNFQKAFEYFSLAAKQECSYSQYNLGVIQNTDDATDFDDYSSGRGGIWADAFSNFTSSKIA